MARKQCKGTRLEVFSGKQAGLNRVILLILNPQKLLAKYDMFLEIKNMKGLRHIDSKTVYRRMGALEREAGSLKRETDLQNPAGPQSSMK